MIAPDLLSILVCPETHQPVKIADAALVENVNRLIAAGQVTNRGGQKVSAKIDGGLVRQDGKVLYPIRDKLPIMLVDEAILLPS